MSIDRCTLCNSESCFRRYYSFKADLYYYHSISNQISIWAPNDIQCNYLCKQCAELICNASWRRKRKANGSECYTNFCTSIEKEGSFIIPTVSNIITSYKTKYSNNGYIGNKNNVAVNANLIGKRNYFFDSLSNLLKERIGAKLIPNNHSVSDFQIDEVASFSVTESKIANQITSIILQHCNNKALCICDGMACAGGNTISFASTFQTVITNEFNYNRYHMLIHNVRSVLGFTNVHYYNKSIVDLIQDNALINDDILHPNIEILFLDPEWGK